MREAVVYVAIAAIGGSKAKAAAQHPIERGLSLGAGHQNRVPLCVDAIGFDVHAGVVRGGQDLAQRINV
ncbi:hypothetical protein D3C72_2214260 [compost metagenome]